ncbi:Bifunctional 3-dehydroquinate dehydratase/shikimate dehydrogenase, chloroplastic [Linum perenne]
MEGVANGASTSGGGSESQTAQAGDTMGELRGRASLIASFASEFDSTAASLQARSEAVRKAEENAAARLEEVEMKEEAFESMMKREMEKLRKQEELAERLVKESEVEKASVEEKLKELAEKEDEFETLGSYIEMRGVEVRDAEKAVAEKRKELEAKEKEIEMERKGFDDQLVKFRQKQAELEVRLIELSVKESEIDNNELKVEFEERVNEFNRKESKLKLRLDELNKKENEIDDKEKHYRELQCRVEQSLGEFKLLEEQIRDRLVEFESKEVELNKKEKEIGEREKRCKEVECKVRQSEEELKLLEEGYQDRFSDLESKEVKVEESLSQLKVQEKEVEVMQKTYGDLLAELNKKKVKVEESLGQLKEKEKEMEVSQKGYRDQLAEFNAKKVKFEESLTQLKEKEMELEMRENGYGDLLAEFNTKKVKFEDSLSQLKEKEKGIEERLKDIKVKEEEHLKKAVEFQVKVQQWYDDTKDKENRWLKDVQAREEAHQKKLDEFQVKVKAWYDDLKAREIKLLEQSNYLERERRNFVEASNTLTAREKEIDARDLVSRTLESEVHELCKELRFRDGQLELRWEETEAKEAMLKKRRDELGSKEREIQQREKKQKELEKQLEECKVREASLEQCSRELIAKGKEFEAKEKRLAELELKVQDYKKRLAKFQVYDSKYKSLKLREKVVEEHFKLIGKRIEEAEFKEKQLEQKLHSEVNSEGEKEAKAAKEKHVEMMSRESAQKAESLLSEVKLYPMVASSSSGTSKEKQIEMTSRESAPRVESPSSQLKLEPMVVMTGKHLQIFLNERSKDLRLMTNEVDTALKLSSDPAKLVLDAMEGFYPPHLKKGDVEFETGVVRKTCIMLLERLKEISPVIKPHNRQKAEKLASEWRARMKLDGDEHGWEFLAFMLLLDGYGIASGYNNDELVNRMGSHYSQTPKSDKISGVRTQNSLHKKPLDNEASGLVSASESTSPKEALPPPPPPPSPPMVPSTAPCSNPASTTSHAGRSSGGGGKRPFSSTHTNGNGDSIDLERVKRAKKRVSGWDHAGSKPGPSQHYSLCATCHRQHKGECRLNSRKCYLCGELGHIQRECPASTTKRSNAWAESGRVGQVPGYSYICHCGAVPRLVDNRAMEDGVPSICWILQFFSVMGRVGSRVCAAVMGESVEQVVKEMHAAKAQGADVAEVRLDCINGGGFEGSSAELGILLGCKPLPVIVVYRPKWEGGEYEGEENSRLEALYLASQLGADYIDIEHKAASSAVMEELRKRRQPGSKIIVSCKLNGPTPSEENLTKLVGAMGALEPDMVRICVNVASITEIERIFHLTSNSQAWRETSYFLLFYVPIAAYSAGERGLISHILSPKYGGALVYGTMGGRPVPGLPSLSSLREEAYKVECIDSETQVFGLISKPVGHSKGPLLHNPAFRHVKYNGVYIPMFVDDLREFFETYSHPDFHGFSVGFPYKEAVVEFCDEVHPLAKTIGAVNTIVRRNGKLIGYNTDCEASITAIEDAIKEQGHSNGSLASKSPLSGKQFVLVGAGGAGRALAFGAKTRGAHVLIFDIDLGRAMSLAQDVCGEARHFETLPSFEPEDGAILANATPVGMHPSTDRIPVAQESLARYQVVFDAVYTPRKTRLLKDADAAGVIIVSGVEMFLRQAIGQFNLFTGKPAPENFMREIVMAKF